MCRIPAAGKNVVTTTFLRRVYPPSLDSSIFGVPAIRAGRGGDRDDRDQVPVRLGRVARRGDAAAGGSRGQWWAATGTGLAATTGLTRRNTNRPLRVAA